MFNFFGLGRSKSEKPVAAPPQPAPDALVNQLSSSQREMVRLTLLTVLKRQGIPANWIGVELMPIRTPHHASALLLQLEVLKWHDALMQYVAILQQELLEGFKRFDPDANPSKYLFGWKFSPDCGCPHTRMPDPSFWQNNATSAAAPKAAASVAAETQKPKFDLPDRDEDETDHGFVSTQINAFDDGKSPPPPSRKHGPMV